MDGLKEEGCRNSYLFRSLTLYGMGNCLGSQLPLHSDPPHFALHSVTSHAAEVSTPQSGLGLASSCLTFPFLRCPHHCRRHGRQRLPCCQGSKEPKRAPDTKVMRRVPELQGRYMAPVPSVTDMEDLDKNYQLYDYNRYSQSSEGQGDTATESRQEQEAVTTGDEDWTKTTTQEGREGEETETQADEETESQADEKTETQADEETETQADGETETQGDGETETQESMEESDTAGGQEACELLAETPAPREVAGSVLEGMESDSQELSLSNVNLNSSKVEEVCQWIMSKANVQSVSLRNVGLTDLHLQRLVDALLSTASLPRVLNLSGNQLTDACVDTLLRFLRSVSCLDILVLQGNRLGDEGVARLAEGLLGLQDAARARLQGPGHDSAENLNERALDAVAVQELDLSELRLTDRATLGLGQLLEADFPLGRLSLAGNPDITLEGWTCIGLALKKNTHLTAISLGHNQLGDQGVEMIARALKHTQSVHQVDLEDNDIGAAGARCLHKLVRDNPCVWELTLSPGNHLPPDFLQEIQRLLERNRHPRGSQ